MPTSFDDILQDKPAEKPVEAPAPEATPEPTPEAKAEAYTTRRKEWRDKEQLAQGRARDPETGQYTKVEAKEPEVKAEVKPEVKPEPKVEVKPPAQEFTEKERAFLKTAEEERRKRQELEKRLADLEAKQPKEPEKKFYDDPDAALARQKEERDRERQEIQMMLATSRVNMSEMVARRHHQDFDEKISVFPDLLKTTPGLYAQWMASPDPAEFAYEVSKNHLEIKEAGSISELRAKIEKETRAKVEAELREKLKKEEEERKAAQAALPGSLSTVAGKGNSRPVWNGPTPFDAILKS